jgi:hypothetical protein
VGKASMTQEDPQWGQERWATDADPGAAGKGKGQARIRRMRAPLAALLQSEAAAFSYLVAAPLYRRGACLIFHSPVAQNEHRRFIILSL